MLGPHFLEQLSLKRSLLKVLLLARNFYAKIVTLGKNLQLFSCSTFVLKSWQMCNLKQLGWQIAYKCIWLTKNVTFLRLTYSWKLRIVQRKTLIFLNFVNGSKRMVHIHDLFILMYLKENFHRILIILFCNTTKWK